MSLGVMGGTFDPIHYGHLAAASEAAFQLGLDAVAFVPTGEPWQKDDQHVTAAADRVEMTARAIAPDPRFFLSHVDVDREGPTYTVDTLRDLAAHFPSAQLHFILGADALAGLGSWKDTAEIFRLARLVGVSRPGYPLQTSEFDQEEERVQLVEAPGLAISSTDCRDRVARKAPLDYLVPPAVQEYIAHRGLYRA